MIVATLAVGWIGVCYFCSVLTAIALLDWLRIPIEPMPGEPMSKAAVAIMPIAFVLATLAAFYGTRIIATIVRRTTDHRR